MSANRVIRLGGCGERLRVQIVEAAPLPEDVEQAAERRWQALCEGNARLFNGRTLAYLDHDQSQASIRACVVPYRHLAVQPQVATGATQLGVTGLLTRGEGEARRVLLARRGPDTRLYPGRWEVAPSGGVDAPPDGVRHLTLDDLRRQLSREMREELGLHADASAAVPVALCFDPAAPSVDVVFSVHLEAEPDAGRLNWEYDQVRWERLRGVERVPGSLDLIEPSRALLEAL
ncbi:MAG: NUDIX hydrolase [Phycisphaerales bacterium]|nr:NUDIX hydrolase [Phycisphaerales bacterium]